MSYGSQTSLSRDVDPSTVGPSTQSGVAYGGTRSNSSNPGIPGAVGFTRTPRTDTIQQNETASVRPQLSQSMIDRQRHAVSNAQGNALFYGEFEAASTFN